VKMGFLFRYKPRHELQKILEELIGNGMPLGFGETPPDHDWLVNCIYTLAPTHPIFELRD